METLRLTNLLLLHAILRTKRHQVFASVSFVSSSRSREARLSCRKPRFCAYCARLRPDRSPFQLLLIRTVCDGHIYEFHSPRGSGRLFFKPSGDTRLSPSSVTFERYIGIGIAKGDRSRCRSMITSDRGVGYAQWLAFADSLGKALIQLDGASTHGWACNRTS